MNGANPNIPALWRRLRARPEGPILTFTLLVQSVCICAGLLWPDEFRYLSAVNLSVLIKSIVPLGVMAIGVGVLMIAGEFDLSVGAIYTFCAIVAALLVQSGVMPTAVAVLLAVGTGALISMLNGSISILLSIPSFIVSLGALLFWKGAALFVHGATSLRFRAEPEFLALFSTQFGIVNAGFLWLCGLLLITYLVMQHHRLGNHIYAVGGDIKAANAIGIRTVRTKLIAYAIVGGCAAFAGILAMIRVGSIQPGGGIGFELEAIAACVIGGVALTGGRGSVIGVFLGTLLVYTVQDVLLLLRAPGFYFDSFVGVLIIASVAANKFLDPEGR